jgi:hypothetical protein
MIYEQIAMERLRPIDINQLGHAQRHHGPLGPRAPRSLVLRPIKPVLRKIARNALVPLSEALRLPGALVARNIVGI